MSLNTLKIGSLGHYKQSAAICCVWLKCLVCPNNFWKNGHRWMWWFKICWHRMSLLPPRVCGRVLSFWSVRKIEDFCQKLCSCVFLFKLKDDATYQCTYEAKKALPDSRTKVNFVWLKIQCVITSCPGLTPPLYMYLKFIHANVLSLSAWSLLQD